MSDAIYFPPLDEGAKVATDVILDPDATLFQLATEFGEACDLVLVAVPAGEGVAVEAAIRRALRVEGS